MSTKPTTADASSVDPQVFWNERYDRDDYLFGERPNAFIAAVVTEATQGQRAYAPADGEGRNGVFLACQGYRVTSLDVADIAVEKANALAERQGVQIDARVGSLFEFEGGLFDIIVVSFMHFWPEQRRQFHQRLIEQLAPGGRLVFEGYSVDQAREGLTSGGPRDEGMLLTPEILHEEFAALSIDLCQNARRVLDEGTRHQGLAATVQLIAHKPKER